MAVKLRPAYSIKRVSHHCARKDDPQQLEDEIDSAMKLIRGDGCTSKDELYYKLISNINTWITHMDYNDFLSDIKRSVIGQPEVDTVLATIHHYLSCVVENTPHNDNMIIAAPSGCGKTELYRALKKYFDYYIPLLPVVIYDMTGMTTNGFSGDNASVFEKIYDDYKYAKGIAIMFLDEFDKKLIPNLDKAGANVNGFVQHQILTLVEGREIEDNVDTGNTLFIGLGAFNHLRTQRIKQPIGFVETTEEHFKRIDRESIIKGGGLYELIGRFSQIINFNKLSNEAILKIIDKECLELSSDDILTIELSKKYKTKLISQANSEFGCRLLKGQLKSSFITAYKYLLKKEGTIDKYYKLKIIDDEKFCWEESGVNSYLIADMVVVEEESN